MDHASILILYFIIIQADAVRFARSNFDKVKIIKEVLGGDEAVAYKSMRMKLKKKGLRRRVFTTEEVRNPPNLYILKKLILIFIRVTCKRSSTRR